MPKNKQNLWKIFLRIGTLSILLNMFIGCDQKPMPQQPLTPASTPAQICTEIGCQDGLNLDLRPQIPEALRVDLRVPGEELWSIYCPSGHPQVECGEDCIFFVGFIHETVTLTLDWDTGMMTRTLQPVYTRVRPNGPDCPPVCQQAEVSLALKDEGPDHPDHKETPAPQVDISPSSGPPGTTLNVNARGFPSNTLVQVEAGRKDTEFGVVEQAQTNAAGKLNLPLIIPDFAEVGDPWVVVVRVVEKGGEKATSGIFSVTEASE